MLAGANRSHRPLEMEAIGKRNEDGVDVGIVKNFCGARSEPLASDVDTIKKRNSKRGESSFGEKKAK